MRPPAYEFKNIMHMSANEIRHIMVVDDEDDYHLITRMMLKKSGYGGKISAFQDPDMALQHLRTTADRPDLLLVDINMPSTDGFEFIRHCNAESLISSSATTVVLCSSSNRPVDIAMADRLDNVRAYVEKPLSEERFLIIAHEHLQRSSSAI